MKPDEYAKAMIAAIDPQRNLEERLAPYVPRAKKLAAHRGIADPTSQQRRELLREVIGEERYQEIQR